PDEEPAPRDRLPLDGLVHYETYCDYDDQRIAEVYQEREVKGWQRYMTYPDLRRKVEESGVENLAQLYTTVKYTRESHQDYSRTVLDYLIEQDFFNN
ncbi:MAG: NADPH-dependent oxidoreductase, partial [Anaerolineae bacterium]|nr:NADPH-dependent oxidoreductase [Anaerolineae bacterium]